MSAKQAIIDKSQRSVPTYLRCSGVANSQIRNGLLLSLVSESFLISKYLAKLQTRSALSSFFLAVCWPGTQIARDNHTLACNFAKYSPIKKIFHSDSAINPS